jgi:hypothetical protein
MFVLIVFIWVRRLKAAICHTMHTAITRGQLYALQHSSCGHHENRSVVNWRYGDFRCSWLDLDEAISVDSILVWLTILFALGRDLNVLYLQTSLSYLSVSRDWIGFFILNSKMTKVAKASTSIKPVINVTYF